MERYWFNSYKSNFNHLCYWRTEFFNLTCCSERSNQIINFWNSNWFTDQTTNTVINLCKPTQPFSKLTITFVDIYTYTIIILIENTYLPPSKFDQLHLQPHMSFTNKYYKNIMQFGLMCMCKPIVTNFLIIC